MTSWEDCKKIAAKRTKEVHGWGIESWQLGQKNYDDAIFIAMASNRWDAIERAVEAARDAIKFNKPGDFAGCAALTWAVGEIEK